MHPPIDCFPFEEDGSNAARLFHEFSRLRRVWMGFHRPDFPARRSEMGLLHCLMHLSEGGQHPVTVGQLARHTQQSMPGISQKLSELEKQGLVQRKAGEDDRRQVMVQITEKGIETIQGPLQDFFSDIDEALAAMGEDKTNQLISLVHELCETMQNAQ